MTDRETIREIPVQGQNNDGFGNIVLGILIAAVIGGLIWAVAT
jgi:hypothetical protein